MAADLRPAIIDDARRRAKRRRVGIALVILAVALIAGAAWITGGPQSPGGSPGGGTASDQLAERRAEAQALTEKAPRPLLLQRCTSAGSMPRIRAALRDRRAAILDSLPAREANRTRADIAEYLLSLPRRCLDATSSRLGG